jgi:hypothetical protein
VNLQQRDAYVAAFRRRVYDTTGYLEFPHQADVRLASEGLTLLPAIPQPGQSHVQVLVPSDQLGVHDMPIRQLTVNEIPCAVVERAVIPRPGGPAHVLADLASYKAGKSYGVAHWAAGFAIVPGAKVHLIGLEYSTSEPEFEYLAEALLSERGMNMHATKYQKDTRGGRMIIVLRTGASYEVKSWDNKESLKGKKITCYLFTEAYMLPGLEVYTTTSQNLRELQGFAYFSSTPDRPWVQIFHDQGHGKDPDWHCTCGVDGTANPFTFNLRAILRDAPSLDLLPATVRALAKRRGLDAGGLMTRERFMIAWLGMLGKFSGRVYDYQRGSRQFTPADYPELFDEDKLRSLIDRGQLVIQ